MTKEIILNHGEIAIVDDEYYEKLSEHRWTINKCGRGLKYALYTDKCNKKNYMHRMIMNAENGMDVDHINGDGLDNRRCNLRICSRGENLSNQRRKTPHSSKYKGVSIFKPTGKWHAQIQHKYESNRSAVARAIVPKALCEEIIIACEHGMGQHEK
jgi:hypothetical protein